MNTLELIIKQWKLITQMPLEIDYQLKNLKCHLLMQAKLNLETERLNDLLFNFDR